MFHRILCCLFCLLASPALAQDPIEYFDSDAVIDGSQVLDWRSPVIVYHGATVTMVGGNYLTNGPGGDTGVDLAGDERGGGFVMMDGQLNTAFFSADDKFKMHGGYIDVAQVGSRISGNAEVFGGEIQELQVVNALHLHGGKIERVSGIDTGWLYAFGDDLRIEGDRVIGTLESGDPIDVNGFGFASIIRSDHIYGDTDFDGDIDLSDLNLVRNNFGLVAAGDANLNGVVDLDDLNLVRNNFGASVRPVPEPSSLLLMGTALFALAGIPLRRRCRSWLRRSP